MDTLILLNKSGDKIGLTDKLSAHEHGMLHMAFSIVLLQSTKAGIMTLIQQRSSAKYHGPGLWSNTCCSHFLPDLDFTERLNQRLAFEMGINAELEYCGQYYYKAKVSSLTEHELDYIYFGWSDLTPSPNADEVMAYKWVNLHELLEESQDTSKYTPWLNGVLTKVADKLSRL